MEWIRVAIRKGRIPWWLRWCRPMIHKAFKFLSRVDMHLAKAEKVPMPEAAHAEGPYAPLSEEQFLRFFTATLWRFYELRRVGSEDDMRSLIQKVDLLTLDPCRPGWASLAMETAAWLAHYKTQLA